MRYETHFCTSADGTRIAYASVPGTGPAVVVVPGWPGTIELVSLDIYPHPLIPGYATVWFDRRGLGLSQRQVDDISLERQIEDVAAIIDDYAGDSTVNLYGIWDGTPITLAYAALYPERLARMAMIGPYARGEDVISRKALESTVEMARTNWSLTRRSLAAIGNVSGPEQTAYLESLRRSIRPEMAAAYLEQYGTMDATQYLDRIKTPTLIVGRSHDPAVPRAGTEFVAARISGCRFVTSENRAWNLEAIREFFWADAGPTTTETKAMVERPAAFLSADSGVTRATTSRPPEIPSGTAIILFADIADSTALTERIGDAAFREKARGLDEAMRVAIRENGGTAVEGKTLGDGVLAVFTSAKQAIACAQACHAAATDADLALHVGIHAGDVIRETDNVFGGAVNIAARVASASAAGETLVSQTVRDLARTSAGVMFEDRGEQSLKGIDDPVRLFLVISKG